MPTPTALDELIAETVPRTTLRDSLVMFLAGLAKMLVFGSLSPGELDEKKGTIADALVANTPVAPAGLGAGPGAVAPEFQVKQDVEPPITTQGATGSGSASNALFPHEVAVGAGVLGGLTPEQDAEVAKVNDELEARLAADSKL